VSTHGQAKSGLGLEAQRDAIEAFAKMEGFKIMETFEERESGKGPTRSTAGRSSPPPSRQRESFVVR
jgi:DNA invertase Pin-like site-specific DNA recombinase